LDGRSSWVEASIKIILSNSTLVEALDVALQPPAKGPAQQFEQHEVAGTDAVIVNADLRLGMMQIDRLIQPPDIRPVALPAAVPGSVGTQDDVFGIGFCLSGL
jgi:hypothetical protein